MGKKLRLIPLLAFLSFPILLWGQSCPSSVSISVDPGSTVCDNTNLTFNSNPTGGSGFTYQWKVNGSNAPGSSTGSTYSSSNLSNADEVTLEISESSTGCSVTSNKIKLTINQERTGSVAISANKTTICPGENVNFSISSSANLGTSATYTWQLIRGGNTTNESTSNSFNSSSLQDGDQIKLTVNSSIPCVSPDPIESNTIDISVKPDIPAQPGNITIPAGQLCPGSSATYTIGAVTGASEYVWTLPSGWSGSSTGTSITATVGNSGGTISVAAKNDCGTGPTRDLAVTLQPGTPATPGTISGTAAVCPGISQTYSISGVSNATEYIWTIPGTWSSTSLTTTSPNLNVTTGTTGGNITVVARNSCGTSTERTFAVTVKAGTPSQPSAIQGDAAVCPGISKTFSVDPISGVTYNWTLPSGWTGSSSGPSITVTTGTTGGTISVTASNDCGTSANPSNLAVTVNPQAPVYTGTITAPTNGVCANQNGYDFSIPTVTNATSYVWTATGGLTIASGQGTRSIKVNTGSSGGTLSVYATNSCGNSAVITLNVPLNNPAPVMTGNITGPARVCKSTTGIQYSIPTITNATSYNWTVPSGWSITNGQGTNTITVTTPATVSTNNTISVLASNSCGNSTPKSYSVNASNSVPAQPGNITSSLTSTAICPPVSNISFSVANVSGNTYNWTLPAGFQIVSGQGTNEIIVNIPSNVPYGNNKKVEVSAVNGCGPSTIRSFNLDINEYALADLGADLTVCSSTSTLNLSAIVGFGNGKIKVQSLTTSGSGTVGGLPGNSPVDNFNYTYTPSSQDLIDGSVILTLRTESPTGKNNCKQEGVDTMVINFRPDPTASVSAITPICSGTTSTVTFTGTPNTTVTYAVGGGSNQTINIGSTGTATLTTSNLTANTTYNLKSVQYQSAPSCTKTLTGSTTINVTPAPTATISYNGPFCTSETNPQEATVTGTGAFTGGTFSQPAGLSINAQGAITPSASTPGTYTIIYTVPASGGCNEVTTSTTVNINDQTTVTTSPVDTRACEGDDVSLSVVANGEDLSYQWFFQNTDPGSEVSGGNQATLSLSNINENQEGDYFVVVSSAASCAEVVEGPVYLTIDQEIVIETQPEGKTLCEDAIDNLSVIATSGGVPLDGTFTYQWYKGNPGSGTALTGQNSPSLPLNTVTTEMAGNYYVEISGNSDFTCQKVVSDVVELIVRPTPTVEISGDAEICEGESSSILFLNGTPNTTATLILNTDNYNPISVNLDSNGEATLDTGELISFSDADTEYIYELVSVAYTNDPTCINNSFTETATITVAPDPIAVFSYGQTEFCTKVNNAQTPSFNEEESRGAYTGGTFSSNGLIIDANDGSFVPGENIPGDYTITYTIPAYGGCPEEEVNLDISIYEEVTITSEPFNLGICSTNDAEFSVVASGDNLQYQWYKVVGDPDIQNGVSETNDIALAGETSNILSLPVATSTDAGEYYVRISGTNACTPTEETLVNSEVVTLNVDEDIIILEPAEDVRVCNDSNENVEFKFVVHANGAPLSFEWIYEDGTPVFPNSQSNVSQVVEERTDYPGLENITVYEGTLSFSNITSANEGSYAVRIDGSSNNFTCDVAISNAFKLDVDPLPGLPTTASLVEYCLNEEAVPLVATSSENGATFTWYDADENELTEAPTPETNAVGTTTYFVTQKDTYCESDKVEITVQINDLPAPPPLTSEEQLVNFCQGEVTTALSATSSGSEYSIKWYGPNDPELALSEAPQPPTNNFGTYSYWVSQTDGNTCESEKVEIVVEVRNIPDITITNPGEETVCEGDLVTLTASDATELSSGATIYTWTWDTGSGELTGAQQSFSPTETTTYTVIAESEFGCVNSEQITINVDPLPNAGNLSGPEAVCVLSPTGSLDLTGYFGTIIQWEYKPEGATEWAVIEETNPDANYVFDGITEPTSYRVLVGSGTCDAIYSNEVTINLDPVPQGGKLLWATNNDRIFLSCENPAPGYGSQLNLSGNIGEILQWEYRGVSSSTWKILNIQNNSLSSSEVEDIINNESTAIRVLIKGNSCKPDLYSETAIVSVIQADIKPTPVEVDKDVICIGDVITLSSETGYSTEGGNIDGGAFDNAGIKNHGWDFTNPDGTVNDFDSAANNGRADHWLRMNPHGNTEPNEKVYTARLEPIADQSPTNGYMVNFRTFSTNAGNKGFALVTGNNDSYMETPVFSLGGLDEAILTWDQAYNLTEGARIRVEVSTNGGASYNYIVFDTIGTATSGNYDNFGDGTPATRPLNKMVVDLGDFLGMSNLRVRFNYEGTIDGDVWAVDNIEIPQGPQDVLLQWYYDDDLNDPDNYLEPIGEVNQGTVQFEPRKIGWNDFEVQTRIILDSNGDQCQSIDNFETIRVWAFDRYETNVEAIVGACGANSITLNATVFAEYQNTAITTYPTADGYVGSWQVETLDGTIVNDGFTLSNQDPEDSESNPLENPNAIFTAENLGDYVFKWILTPTEVDENGILIDNSGCPPLENPMNVTLVDCTTLDFDGIDDHIVIADGYSGAQTIEAWIRPEAENGATAAEDAVIISNANYQLYITNGQKLVFEKGNKKVISNRAFTPDTRWYHVAVVFDGDAVKMYIDGIEINDKNDSGNSGSLVTANTTIIGGRFVADNQEPDNYYSGWIEEVRIWNTPVSLEQIRFLMNQHIDYTQAPNLRGEIIPLAVPGGLNYANLLGYYRLIAQNDGVDNTDAAFLMNNGYTPDMASNPVDGRLRNIETWQENTAPMPYYSRTASVINPDNRSWMTDDTWRHWEVWDPPNSRGIDQANTLINWNIAVISHNIDSGNIESGRDTNPFSSKEEYALTLLGLISQQGLLRMATPGENLDENNSGQHLRVTHYLDLDGNIDLVGESQLVQDQGSVLDENSAGWLERDQQGTRSSYNYNYWSSPVSAQASKPNNADYTIGGVLLDGTDSANPGGINYQPAYHAADHGARTSPITLSTYWMWRFRGTADVYGQWKHVEQTGTLQTGEGYTMKGTSGTASVTDLQNYVYKGKPHNGDFTRPISANMNYLLGNPYPSAMDANIFIRDNLDSPAGNNTKNVFNGVLYFWDHFAGQTHYLEQYIGGYAAYSLAGGVPGVALDPRVNNNNQSGTKTPSRFIPVAQGFFLLTNGDTNDQVDDYTAQAGDVVFRNGQRIGAKEGIIYETAPNSQEDPSVFLKPEYPAKDKNQTNKDHYNTNKDSRTKIRLRFKSPKNYQRQILVTKDENTSDGYDIGYDAPLPDDNVEDMYWLIGERKFVIQAVPDFNNERVLPLGIKVDEGTEFTFQIDTVQNWPEGKRLYIKDNQLDTIHDILESPYTSTAEKGTIHDRFELVFHKEKDDISDPEDPTDPIVDGPGKEDPTEELPEIDGLVGISYSTFRHEVKIANYDLLDIQKVIIYNMNGQLIQEFEGLPTQKEINLGMRPVRTGVYIVKAICENGVCNKKIIVR
ncbi:T9SS type A sorting domain-containing protein [Gramella sp. BOM4]|nr:T9SS type A sorting domain-containing protein [Christiangramia bathymodioli]